MIAAALKNLVEAIKLSPRYLLPVCLFSGFVVFAPPETLSIFGLTDIVERYRPWFGLAFLASSVLLLGAALAALYGWLQTRRRERAMLKHGRRRLKRLTEDEKAILRGFIEGQTRTQYLPISDGRVRQFEMERIIFRASKLGQYPDAFAYNIQPWAWEYLNKHPEVLDPGDLPPAVEL
jgi:hypothetical protein